MLNFKLLIRVLFFCCCLHLLHACKKIEDPATKQKTLFFIDYRHLAGGSDGIAVMELDPESPDFGKILHRTELGKGVLPHHLYFNRDEKKLYTTALGGSYLYELKMEWNHEGYPVIYEANPVNTGGNTVGEDIFFTRNGQYWVTFMGGKGGVRDGSVGVFDAHNNQLIKTISSSIDEHPDKFIMYPHGISIFEDKNLAMVTSTIHPDLTSGIGNTCTLIDMNTYNIIKTYRVADSATDLSSPVEVLLLRNEYPRYALANTMIGGDIWMAAFDDKTNQYSEFKRVLKGANQGLGWALEFYIADDKLLYVSFGQPGKILVFDLNYLPELRQVRTLPADKGAHHMAFFKTKSGRSVVAVQNNLLNLPNLNAGTIDVVDINTGEKLGTVDMRNKYQLLPESIEGTLGKAHYMHH
ncbi:YncE family protein [Chitinophaga sp. 22536]|uniref:YncE family protein n=1 Tax=unclassified Chitinophaga TaxID=2619133 RepID=UPI003F83F005